MQNQSLIIYHRWNCYITSQLKTWSHFRINESRWLQVVSQRDSSAQFCHLLGYVLFGPGYMRASQFSGSSSTRALWIPCPEHAPIDLAAEIWVVTEQDTALVSTQTRKNRWSQWKAKTLMCLLAKSTYICVPVRLVLSPTTFLYQVSRTPAVFHLWQGKYLEMITALDGNFLMRKYPYEG